MRNEFLRDVIAGSAGILAVLALIGLPKDHSAPTHHMQVQWHGTRLLPYYTPFHLTPLYYMPSPPRARPTP